MWLALLGGGCVMIGMVMAMLGAWLVLPFVGLELALLIWAFRQIAKGDQDFERFSVGDGIWTYQARHGAETVSGQGALKWLGFDQWQQHGRRRLRLRYAGRTYPLGAFLTDGQCVTLGRDLQGLIDSVRRDPLKHSKR